MPSADDAAVFSFVILLYVEHLIFGANRGDLSLFFAILHLLILLAALATRASRRALDAAPLVVPGGLFALVLAGAFFTLLPLGGRIGHPLWSYVSASGGSVSLDPAATRVEIVKLLGLAAVFAVGIVFGAKRERAEAMIRALSYVGGAFAVWAFLSWSNDPDTIFGTARFYGSGRLAAAFLSANSAATLFACQSVLQLCLAIRAVQRAPKPFFSKRAWMEMKGLPAALILLFINVSCLLLTQSRAGVTAAFAAMALAIALFALVRTDRRSAVGGVMGVGGLLLCAAAGLVLLKGQSLLGRMSDNPLMDGRLAYFGAYWRTVQASPWWGYGLGAFASVKYQSITAPTAVLMGALGAAHNVYLQWLLQTGVIGFVPMMGCLAVILATILNGFRRRSRQQVVMIVALAVTVVFAFHGMTDYALEEPSLAVSFAALLGLAYGVATRT
jgi:O-antigen ligase